MKTLSHGFAWLRQLAFVMFLIGIATHTLAAKTYSDNGDGTVTDSTTGLVWMRCSIGQDWDGMTCTGTAQTFTFDEANALVGTGMVTFAGKSDWRLPNIRELQTIVDRSIVNPAIDKATFPNTIASFFWSSSANSSSSEQAWYVYFYHGHADYDFKSGSYQVRLVRAGQSDLVNVSRPSSDYVDNADGTVTHTPTGLMWQKCAIGQTWSVDACSGEASTYAWEAARLLTSNLAGQTDWRLPTEDELLSLADYTKSNPAINTSIFPGANASNFWSASALAGDSNYAWYVYLYDGYAYGLNYKTDAYHVRLVRAGLSFATLPLTISKNGAGMVGNTLAGLGCGTACTGSYTHGTQIILTATPATNLISWSGACTGSEATCVVTMDAAKSVVATFRDTALIFGLPETLTFTAQNMGSTSVAKTITLGNIGTVPLQITSIATNSDFAVSHNCGTGIGVNSFCTLTVIFQPTDSGSRTGSLTITDDALASPHTVSLNGTGLAVPVLLLEPSSLVFTTVAVGINSAVQTIKLTNTGKAALNLTNISTVGDFSQTNNCGTGLSAGGCCNVNLAFKPTAAGIRTGVLNITSNALGSPHAVSLTGDIQVNTLNLSPGWNLLGNGTDQQLALSAILGDKASNVSTVWKWDLAKTGWQFYSPSMDATTLQTYTINKNYGVLSQVNAGEGFWVNAAKAFSLTLPSGIPISGNDFQEGRPHALKKGWNLVAIGTALTPSAFNTALSTSMPETDVVPINLTTLWAWDNLQSKWYFYAPNMDAQGGTAQTDYIINKGYLDFTNANKMLDIGTGFWVNKQ